MTKRSIFLVCSIFLVFPLWGQSELNTYFLDHTGANQYLNPANAPEATFSWYLPNVYYIHGSEGAGILQILRKRAFNPEMLDGKLKGKNSMVYALQASLGSLHFNFDPVSFHIGQNFKYYTQLDYNKLLFDVLINGNAPYIGQTINIGPNGNLLFYNEFFMGVGVRLENFKLGLRVKRLNGFLNLYTPKHEFSIYTSDEIYQLKFNTEYHIRTNLLGDDLSFGSYLSQLSGNITNNSGWGFDFGMQADVSDKFTISASLLDMGKIQWKNQPTKIITEGNFEFNGFDFKELIQDSLNFLQLDSLAEIIQVSELDESYISGTPVQFYLGFQYYPSEYWEINALYYNAYSTGRSKPAVYIAGKYKPSHLFHGSLSYTWNQYAAVNFGLGLETHLGWFHAFLIMDNVLDIIRPVGGNYFNARFGVQIDLVRN